MILICELKCQLSELLLKNNESIPSDKLDLRIQQCCSTKGNTAPYSDCTAVQQNVMDLMHNITLL